MGFTQHTSNAPLFNIRYSAFLGTLFLSDEHSRAAISAQKAEIGEEIVKKGFQGNNSESTKAVAKLRDQGVLFGRMTGRLTGVRKIERDVSGRPTPYLSVTLSDDDGKYNLSIPVGDRAAQMLVRKLVNAKPELFTELNMFATFGQRPGADRAYAEHGASLKQGDHPVEVAGVNPKDVLVPLVDTAMAALSSAGIEESDKDTRGKRRASITTQYHVELIEGIQKAFEEYYAAREQSQPVSTTYGHEPADEYDDIPM